MAIPEGTLPAEPAPRPDRGPLEANPHIFVLLEGDRPRALSARHSLAGTDRVIVGRGAQRGASREARTLHLTLPDRWLSTSHSTLLRDGKGPWILRDTGSRNGTRVNGEHVRERAVTDGDIVEVGHTLLLFRNAVETYAHEFSSDVDAARQLPPARGMLSIVPGYERQLAQLQQIAPSNVDVLLLGQSGTGKEVIARAIAQLSRRRGAFVAVNCGGIPDQLMESEMFGSVRGAFSGAVADRVGLVRTADGGTLFLDEIADLPMASQAALLRVLQERQVRPVGGTRAMPVDIRVIAATHRDINGMVADGSFRTDLFARLAGFQVTLPPLARRMEDIGVLIGSLLSSKLRHLPDNIRFECDAARALFRYPWPLNVRELENAISTASLLAGDAPIDISHLPEQIRLFDPRVTSRRAPKPLSFVESEHRAQLVALMTEHDGNISAVSRATGKARQQVHRWLKRYGIDPAGFR